MHVGRGRASACDGGMAPATGRRPLLFCEHRPSLSTPGEILTSPPSIPFQHPEITPLRCANGGRWIQARTQRSFAHREARAHRCALLTAPALLTHEGVGKQGCGGRATADRAEAVEPRVVRQGGNVGEKSVCRGNGGVKDKGERAKYSASWSHTVSRMGGMVVLQEGR
jgi:hypothetical protein